MECPSCGKEMRKVYTILNLKEALYKCENGHRRVVKE